MADYPNIWHTYEFQYGSRLIENPPLTDNDKGLATTYFVNNAPIKSTVVEVDFGSTPAHEKTFTITDATVINTDWVSARIEDIASTNKSKDDIEMESFYIMASANTGSIDVLIRSLQGRVQDKFKIRYFVNKT